VFALAIGHRVDDRVIIDVVRGRAPPFDPQAVVAEYSVLMKDYRCLTAHGDNYSAD
jgi:hypothetical protein